MNWVSLLVFIRKQLKHGQALGINKTQVRTRHAASKLHNKALSFASHLISIDILAIHILLTTKDHILIHAKFSNYAFIWEDGMYVCVYPSLRLLIHN